MLLHTEAKTGHHLSLPAGGLKRIALLGNSLPRRCGLATYTSHVLEALNRRYPAVDVDLYAMTDPGRSYAYPETLKGTIRQEQLYDYRRAAATIEASGADLLWVQHEFGIFGGPAGSKLLTLLERLSIPIAITLHSVLDLPTADQRLVMDGLIRKSHRLIVMAEKGREILRTVYGVADRQIAVIPHGVPDRPYVCPDRVKPDFGWSGKRVLLTFGLLSPNKGIETVIEAMPRVLEADPDTIYVVAGATHPHLVAHEGEAYRIKLRELAEQLGVGSRICWADRFLGQEELLHMIAAADIYVTPYLDLKQITSGALAYAVALGKPVVSTPYHHAAEIIRPELGLLASPGEVKMFADAICSLLQDRAKRLELAANAYALGRSMIWCRNVEAAFGDFTNIVRSETSKVRHRPARSDQPALAQMGAGA